MKETSISNSIQKPSHQNRVWDRTQALSALRGDMDATLFREADELREKNCGDAVHRRGLIEFSNICRENCAYCGLRRGNIKIQRYRMTVSQIVDSAMRAEAMGYGSVVLQSGEEGAAHADELCTAIAQIKSSTELAVTLSVGEQSREVYQLYRDAGADRYLLRFETSNPGLFQKLRPGRTLDGRLRCLAWLRELGFQVGSGCMVGLPGQTLDDLADDLFLIQKLDLDMVGVGPFIPHPETPLYNESGGGLELVLRFIALVRLMTKNTHIPATTALGSIHPLGRQKALQGGANVIMPNVTPQEYRKFYEIYPNKICITEKPSDCAGCVGSMIHSLGRKIAVGPGHSLRQHPANGAGGA